MNQSTTLGLNVINLLRRTTREDMTEWEDAFVGKSVKLNEFQCQ